VALPELLEALRAEAAERRAAELARADAETARIREESRASLERRRAEHVERAARDATEAARRSLAEARSQAARSMLEARDRLLGRIRGALEERTRNMNRDPEYRAAVAEELVDALERLPPGRVVVRTRPDLADVALRVAEAGPDRGVETAPDLGAGFVAVSPETGVEIDATLEVKLLHRWPRLAVAVMKEVSE
jgi:vacuolar-type H+-ATPase subunit E/Vma4